MLEICQFWYLPQIVKCIMEFLHFLLENGDTNLLEMTTDLHTWEQLCPTKLILSALVPPISVTKDQLVDRLLYKWIEH